MPKLTLTSGHPSVEIARLQKEVADLRGAMAAQDEREHRAAELLGMPHGCDWPDAVADEIIALRMAWRDKARMDWLEQRLERSGEADDDIRFRSFLFGNGKRVTGIQVQIPADGSTELLREAIDAAMRKEPK